MIEIPLLEKIYSNKLLADLLNNNKQLKPFHNGSTLEAINNSFLTQRDFELSKRKVLVNTVSKQYTSCDLPIPEKLDNLLNKGAFTVTTGHQLCLFGGPQYFIHKIISVISLAKKLKAKFPENEFVPIFWMASEDHDFQEISNINLFNKKLSVERDDSIAVGKLSPLIFKPIIDELKIIFENDSRFNELAELFNNALKKNTWAQATRFWLSKLFRDTDLVIIDPDEKVFKQMFSSSISNEITNQFVYSSVKFTNDKLTSMGYQPKINPRELNLFYLADEKRYRIIFEGNLFLIGDKSYSKDQLLEQIQNNPERFSPNVLLRPLYQETILPNLIYVGGPSEIAYWTQLKNTFDHQKTPFPILMLRDHFSWLNLKQIDLWKKMGFKINDLVNNPDELIKHFLKATNSEDLSLSKQEAFLNQIETELGLKATKIDPSLVPMVNGAVKGMKNSLNKIQQKFLQSLKRSQDQELAKIKKISSLVIDKGVLKERSENFLGPYLSSSNDYIQTLIEASNPESNSLKILIY